MKVLVTGREGQLARSLAEIGRGRLDMTFVARPEFDLLDPAGMERVIDRLRPDIVVNAAAYTAVDAAEDDAETAMAANGVAPGAIARAAVRIGARMVHLSTDYVFDGTLDRPYREDDTTNPLSVYGRTKLAGERTVVDTGVAGAIVRTSWVYSPFGRNFVSTMLRLAESRDEVTVVADQTGCPTSALDLAEAIVRLIERWNEGAPAPMTLYHATGRGGTTWAELAREVFAVRAEQVRAMTTVRDISTDDYPTKARRPHNSVLDGDKLRTALGWSMPDWKSSVRTVAKRVLAVGQ